MSIEELSKEECLELLQRESYVGRVAFISGGRPKILGVNYMADDKTVVFCTIPGEEVSDLLKGAPVAFEVDAIRPLYNAGWSVTVEGTAEEVVDPGELEKLQRGPLKPWATTEAEHWIRITIEDISGSRVPDS
jgi:nitroimidazol reductase NimA-like FMN-containing flavoprotein (pyridoxamine 5'-phosphate oxidase superfamily)